MSLILICQLCQANHILTHRQMMLLTKKQSRKRKPKKGESANLNSANVFRICGIMWESAQDEETDPFWIGCAGKSSKCKKD